MIRSSFDKYFDDGAGANISERERDNFYDKNMHGVDWDAMYKKYLPLLEAWAETDYKKVKQQIEQVMHKIKGAG